jgi:hypothetical protein
MDSASRCLCADCGLARRKNSHGQVVADNPTIRRITLAIWLILQARTTNVLQTCLRWGFTTAVADGTGLSVAPHAHLKGAQQRGTASQSTGVWRIRGLANQVFGKFRIDARGLGRYTPTISEVRSCLVQVAGRLVRLKAAFRVGLEKGIDEWKPCRLICP